jgi:hypothetical protein
MSAPLSLDFVNRILNPVKKDVEPRTEEEKKNGMKKVYLDLSNFYTPIINDNNECVQLEHKYPVADHVSEFCEQYKTK